jgi:CDGSH-type Zn-finger protein
MNADSVIITECTNGPLLVRGAIQIEDSNGNEVELTRSTVALCRCGVSTIKPFCDGSHKLSGFRTN